MDIEKNWQKIAPTDNGLEQLLSPKHLASLQSTAPLAKLKRNILINGIWGAILMVPVGALLFYFPQLPVRIGVIAYLLFSVWVLFGAAGIYRRLQSFMPSESNLLSELNRHYDTIQHWSKTQQLVAIFIYPITTSAGFLMGGMVGSKLDWFDFLSKPAVPIILIVTLIITTPLCYYGTKWLMQYTFGKHLDRLKANIDALSAA